MHSEELLDNVFEFCVVLPRELVDMPLDAHVHIFPSKLGNEMRNTRQSCVRDLLY
jgi:hypothetical protein